jgi:hypothetical protein
MTSMLHVAESILSETARDWGLGPHQETVDGQSYGAEGPAARSAGNAPVLRAEKQPRAVSVD